jgi:hypothetical protein
MCEPFKDTLITLLGEFHGTLEGRRAKRLDEIKEFTRQLMRLKRDLLKSRADFAKSIDEQLTDVELDVSETMDNCDQMAVAALDFQKGASLKEIKNKVLSKLEMILFGFLKGDSVHH